MVIEVLAEASFLTFSVQFIILIMIQEQTTHMFDPKWNVQRNASNV